MKKTNAILSTFIKIALIFIFIDTILGIFPSSISSIITNSKYSTSIIAELTAALVSLIVVILSCNNHIFTEKKENLIDSIHIGLPMFLLSTIYLLSSLFTVITSDSFTTNNLISLMIYCFSIGLFEELLCRGWILNEFLKVSDTTRKDVITSIVVSALLFGLMHISNIWVAGQNPYITFLQICNAIALGSFLGAVYYRTKNIWAVIFLHAYYDFSLLLGEIHLLKDCTTNTLTKNVMIYETISISVIIVVFILCTIIILRKSKLNPLLEEPTPLSKDNIKLENRHKLIYIIAIIGLMIIPIPQPSKEEYIISQTCYHYNTVYIDEYDITTTNKTKYNIHYLIHNYIPNFETEDAWIDNTIPDKTVKPDDYDFDIIKDDTHVTFINKNTNYKIQLEYPYIYNLYVYTDKENTIILIQTREDYDSVIYYSNYIHKNNLSNEPKYLEELSESFTRIVTPDSKELGILTTENNTYPLIKTINGDIMIIEEEQLLLVK